MKPILSPWVKAAITPDQRASLRQLPDDYQVELYGSSARGPWQCHVKRGLHREVARIELKRLDACVVWALATAKEDEVRLP